MTQDLLIEEVKRVHDPEAIAALYSYALYWTSGSAKANVNEPQNHQTGRKPYSWGDIVPIKAKSGRSTKEMTDWVRS
ncbi:hypothetical protein AGMMS49982_07440 [Bacteroidia bacterium]|nr:hypothetical protein AGMMS49982_07440 [Bacteroidia bacterium]